MEITGRKTDFWVEHTDAEWFCLSVRQRCHQLTLPHIFLKFHDFFYIKYTKAAILQHRATVRTHQPSVPLLWACVRRGFQAGYGPDRRWYERYDHGLNSVWALLPHMLLGFSYILRGLLHLWTHFPSLYGHHEIFIAPSRIPCNLSASYSRVFNVTYRQSLVYANIYFRCFLFATCCWDLYNIGYRHPAKDRPQNHMNRSQHTKKFLFYRKSLTMEKARCRLGKSVNTWRN